MLITFHFNLLFPRILCEVDDMSRSWSLGGREYILYFHVLRGVIILAVVGDVAGEKPGVSTGRE